MDFTVHTDHQPLVYLHNMQIVNTRLARTLQDLSDYSFVIKYTPGKSNTGADALSRLSSGDIPVNSDSAVLAGDLPDGLILMERVPGGGNSIPDSLMAVATHARLVGIPDNSFQLRGVLVSELLRSPDRYGLQSRRNLTQELRLMMHDNQLLCVESLVAFSRLYSCVVLVHYGGEIPVVYSDKSVKLTEIPRIHLQCIAGVHYNPVVETTSYIVPPLLDESLIGIVNKPVRECVSGPVPDEVLVQYAHPKADWSSHHAVTHMASIQVNIGGTAYCALLDSGAQVSCLAEQVCIDGGCFIDDSHKFSILGLGTSCSPVVGSSEIEFSLGFENVYQCQFAVVKSHFMPFCMILGIDFLQDHNFQLDFANRLTTNSVDTWSMPTVQSSLESGFVSVVSIDILRAPGRLHVGERSDGVMFEVGLTFDGPSDHSTVITALVDSEDLKRLQHKDKIISSLRRRIENQEVVSSWPKTLSRFRRYASSLIVQDGFVMYQGSNASVCVIPFPFLVELALVVHHKMAHPGRQKLLSMITEHVWHPSVAKVASDVSRSCLSCQKVKVASTVHPPTLKISTSSPFELVAVDLVAFPTTRRGNSCCLVMVDHNSKFMSAVPLKSKHSSVVSAAMKERILPFLFKIPSRVMSDNGKEFVGHDFVEMLAEFGIKHTLTTPYHPSSNGLVERTNRTIAELLRNLSAEPLTWDDDLIRAVMVYNNTHHAELRMSPSKYLLSRPHSMVDNPVLPTSDTAHWREGNPSFLPYKVGQLVLRRVVLQGHQVVNKLADRFSGPFSVIKVNDNRVSYVIQSLDSRVEHRVHHTQLRPYHEPPGYIGNHPYYVQLFGEQQEYETENEVIEPSPSFTAGLFGCGFSLFDGSSDSESDSSDSTLYSGSSSSDSSLSDSSSSSYDSYDSSSSYDSYGKLITLPAA